MEPIEFNNRNNPDLKKQLTFLIKREFYVTYYRGIKFSYYLIGATLILLGVLQFTPSDDLIVLKSMSIISLTLTWACTLIYLLIILIKWFKRYLWRNKSIVAANKQDVVYKLYFNEEKIFFEGPTYKTEMSWDHYTYWTENNNSIFIFPANNLYDCVYYSVSDLGVNNYILFKNIAALKLKRLSE